MDSLPAFVLQDKTVLSHETGFDLEEWKAERSFQMMIDDLRRLKSEPLACHLTLRGDRRPLEDPRRLHDEEVEREEEPIGAIKDREATNVDGPLREDKEVDEAHLEEDREALERCFGLWREAAEERRRLARKAELYNQLSVKFRCLHTWKELARRARTRRTVQQKSADMEEACLKAILADRYRDRNLCFRVFDAWLTLARVSASKRKIEELKGERESTKAKVREFLASLSSLTERRRAARSESRRSISAHFDPRKPGRQCCRRDSSGGGGGGSTAVANSSALPRMRQERRPDPRPDPRPEPRPRTSKKGSEGSVQQEIIEAQRRRLREQWRTIEELKQLKKELTMGRSCTKLQLLNKITRTRRRETKLKADDEAAVKRCPTVGSEDQNVALVQREEQLDVVASQPAGDELVQQNDEEREEEEEEEDGCRQDYYHYSDDFEECSDRGSSVTSVVPRTPEFLRRVQQKSELRKRRLGEIRKFHELKAAEERARKAAAAAAELREEEEERRARREVWKERKRQEGERQRRRAAEEERRREAEGRAAEHHRRLQLQVYGVRPWLRLVADLRLKKFQAECLYKQIIVRKYFVEWLHMTRSSALMKRLKADNHCKLKLLHWSWTSWAKEYQTTREKRQSAEDLSDLRLTARWLRRWREASRAARRREYSNTIKAQAFYRRFLIRRHFFLWIKYMMMKETIARCERDVELLKSKVALVVPDYVPCREN